jgi:glutamate carboxypeptidase
MTAQEQAVCSHLASRKAAMIDLLGALVSIDSQSRDSEGVTAVTRAIDDFLRARGIATQSFINDAYGKCLRAAAAPSVAAPVVMMGHCDTVFPRGEAARRPFRVADGRAYGPGVSDMKGGLVLNAFILEALATLGENVTPAVALFTADEEIASPWSRTIISETCRGARAVFNSEAGRPSGNIVSARNGGVFFRMEVEGRPAHSGANFTAGINAVTEAAHKVLAVAGITDLGLGITANPGAIGGGQAFNIVAANAFIEGEVRYRSVADRARLRAEIERIASTCTIEGAKARLIVHGEFPPMEESAGSRALKKIYYVAAKDAGFTTQAEFSGGCSDAGITASDGIPTLCGVGPIGGQAHTEREYLEIESLVPRAQALAVTVMRASAAVACAD